MNKFGFLLFLLSLFAQISKAQLSNKEIAILKVDLVKAVDNTSLTDSLLKRLNALSNKNALLTGYTATLEALKAKHAWNPYNKIKFVKRSLSTMQKAINMDKENMEIRFMRFSIEHFTPGFLGFSKDLDEDRKEIVKHYQNNNFGLADDQLIKNVAKFMIESKRCTAAEIKIFKKYI
ncbi:MULTISPECIES: hypothetical protein [unclassified Pedobacter]|uniref:hypothetical protein n=1 Tax=unclassified Pedobacter TaxID=2628915 RepID=UPI001E560D90|nr:MULTISPECIES: hypothetical protein [unclassified Pedobacter]